MAGISPMTVVSWNEFMADPSLMYNLFSRNPATGKFQFDPARVNVMAGSNSRTIKVETMSELEQWEHDLLSKPLLLDAAAIHSKTDNYVFVRVTTRWRGSFAVLLNPLNPAVRRPMQEKFQKAKESLAAGKKFCLEFDFGPCLESWYAEMVDGSQGWYSNTKSSLTRFYITNCSHYQHCFDCNPLWCILGLPCWLLSAPCYMTYRCCTVDDDTLVFNLPVIMRTPLARDLVVELVPERDRHRIEANRQAVQNRVNREQHTASPEVFAPERMINPGQGAPRAPTGAPVAPPPYSPPAYTPLPAVTQQPHAIPPPPANAPRRAPPVGAQPWATLLVAGDPAPPTTVGPPPPVAQLPPHQFQPSPGYSDPRVNHPPA